LADCAHPYWSSEGVAVTTVDDAPCRGFLPARVMRGAAVGDPECVFVGVHLVEVEASWVLDVSVDVEHQASRLITQRSRGIDRYGVDELVDFVRVDVECDEQGVHNLCLNQWVDSAAGCEPIEFIDRLCRESDHAGSRCDRPILDLAWNENLLAGCGAGALDSGYQLIDALGEPLERHDGRDIDRDHEVPASAARVWDVGSDDVSSEGASGKYAGEHIHHERDRVPLMP